MSDDTLNSDSGLSGSTLKTETSIAKSNSDITNSNIKMDTTDCVNLEREIKNEPINDGGLSGSAIKTQTSLTISNFDIHHSDKMDATDSGNLEKGIKNASTNVSGLCCSPIRTETSITISNSDIHNSDNTIDATARPSGNLEEKINNELMNESGLSGSAIKTETSITTSESDIHNNDNKIDGTGSGNVEEIDNKSINDPYAYIDRNGFTSEKFKIEIRGLPKFYGIGELKKLFNTKLKLGSNKIKPPRQRSQWVYVCFRSEEHKEEALKVIDGLKWKNTTLRATAAKPAPDPLVKRRKEAQEVNPKRQKLDDSRTQEERLKNSTVPLWELSKEDQAQRKNESVKILMRKIVYEIERQNGYLKTYFNTQRDNNEGSPLEISPLLMSPQINGYRNKCEFTIGTNDETGEKTVGLRLGSYANGTVGVGPIGNLPHIPDLMKQAVKIFEEFVQASPLEVFNPETYLGHWRQLTVRLGTNTGQLMLVVGIHPQQMTQPEVDSFKQDLCEYFSSGRGKSLNITSLYYQEIVKRKSGGLDQTVQLVWGEDHITERMCGLHFNISPLSFFQVNTNSAELLYGAVSSLARLTLQTTLVDVCCGTGSIGLSLAKDCGQVLGLELMEQAVVDARQNAALNNITNCEFFSGPAEEILQSVVDKAKFDDVVAIVDPPRAGLRMNAVVMLRRIAKIKKIAYLACDLKSASKNIIDLARPASKTLAGAPFVPMAVTPVDMFPHTPHCEVIIYLERMEVPKTKSTT